MKFLRSLISNKRNIAIVLVALAGGYFFDTRGTDDATSYLVYFSGFFFYWIVTKSNPKWSALFGAILGALHAHYSYHWLDKFVEIRPYQLTLIFNAVMYASVFAFAAYLVRRYHRSEFVHIFALSLGFFIIRTLIHYSPVVPYAKAFMMIANTSTIFDWLVPYLGSSIIDVLSIAAGCLVARGAIHLRRKNLPTSFVGFSLLFGVIVLGAGIVPGIIAKNDAARPAVRVALIQGNFDWTWEDRMANTNQMLDYFEKESSRSAQLGAKIIVWPEYAVPKDLLHGEPMIGERIVKLSHALDAVIVLGSLENVPGPTRPDGKWNGYDVSLVFDPKKILLEPYRAVFPFTDNVLSGTKPIIFDSTFARFPVISCFEVANHKFVNDYSRMGKPLDLIISIANIQLFNGTDGHARIRNHIGRVAAENGRYFVYVANTGPSFVFDRLGRIVATTKSNERSTLLVDVPRITQNTLYSTFQELPLLLLLTGPILYFEAKKRRKSAQKSKGKK